MTSIRMVMSNPHDRVETRIADSTHVRENLPQMALPLQKYTPVGVDIDTTGRRLIDEIVQLAAFTPKDHFEQYIMPYMNLNPAARQRHQVRVISIGFYRMLKSMQTYKIIKSKSEIAALKDFLAWLESVKAKDVNSLGIVLIYHEERKFIPYMILESLKKYNLLDRFQMTVKAFANGINLARNNSNEALQHYSIRKLAKALNIKTSGGGDNVNGGTNFSDNDARSSSTTTASGSSGSPQQSPQKLGDHAQTYDRDLFEGNASVRAKLAYEVAVQLSNNPQQVSSSDTIANDSVQNLLAALQPFVQPIEYDINELHTQNENLERQNSFRPVFLNYFKTTLYHRVRAVKFRIILAENGFDLVTLNSIWAERQKDGLIEVLQVVDELKPDDKVELVDLLDSYFDPNKATIKPILRNNNNRRRNRRGVRNSKFDGNASARSVGPNGEQGAGGDKQIVSPQMIPDSLATKIPAVQSGPIVVAPVVTPVATGKAPRARRYPRSRNNSYKAAVATVAVSTNTLPILASN